MVTTQSRPQTINKPIKLTIIPPPNLQLPPTLLIHHVERPSQTSTSSAAGKHNDDKDTPHPVRCHPAFLRARKSLAEVNLKLPNPLLADRGMWLSLVVDEVEFDLAGDDVRVTLTDGTTHSWEFSRLDSVKPGEGDGQDERISLASLGLLADEGFVATLPLVPILTSTQPVSPAQEHLHQLTTELHKAFEDLPLSAMLNPDAPKISTESDYRTLVAHAADPNLELPDDWLPPPRRSCNHLDPDTRNEVVQSKPRPDPASPAKKPSPLSQSSSSMTDDEDSAEEDKLKFKGQLENTRRPRSVAQLDKLDQPTTGVDRPIPAQYDLFLMISLLSAIRKTVVDLFSLKILALIKTRIGAPTYSIWAADRAGTWCKRLARQKGAQVSRLVLQLLDDVDGDQFDRSDDSDDQFDEEASRMEVEDEGEWAGFGGFGGFFMTMDGKARAPSPTLSEKQERRRKKNPFSVMRDDYDLRIWCQKATSRIIIGFDNSLSDVEVNSDDDGGPNWLRPVPPWEVSRLQPRMAGQAKSRPGKIRQPRDDKKLASTAQQRAKDHAAASQGLRAARGSFSILGAMTPPSTPTSSPPVSGAESDTTECSGEEGGKGVQMTGRGMGSKTFRIEDPLGAELLPMRLPHALLRDSASLGREMSLMREKVHSVFNQIAGLQKKIVELERFVKKQTAEWNKARHDERTPKETAIVIKVKPAKPDSVPLALQPLRLSTADRTISHSIDASLRNNGPKGDYSRNFTVGPIPPPPRSPPSPGSKRTGRSPARSPPRKRQKQNVDTIATVLAAQQAERDEGSKKRAGALHPWSPNRAVQPSGGAGGVGRGKGKARVPARRTLSWPDGLRGAGPMLATAGPGASDAGLLPPPAISASLREAIANPAGLLFTELEMSLLKAAPSDPSLATCSYAGGRAGPATGSPVAASKPWMALPRVDEGGDDNDGPVHDIQIGEHHGRVDGQVQSSLWVGGTALNPPALAELGRPSNPARKGLGKWGFPSNEHLRGRVLTDSELINSDWDAWSVREGVTKLTTIESAGTATAFGHSKPATGARLAVLAAPPLSSPCLPERSSSSFPMSFGAYNLSALPLTPPWDPSALPVSPLPALQQPGLFATLAERDTGDRSPPLVSLPPISTVLVHNYGIHRDGPAPAAGEQVPAEMRGEWRSLGPPQGFGLIAPKPQRGVQTSAFLPSMGRPEWLDKEEGGGGGGGRGREQTSAAGGVARLSPERLGGLRKAARSASPKWGARRPTGRWPEWPSWGDEEDKLRGLKTEVEQEKVEGPGTWEREQAGEEAMKDDVSGVLGPVATTPAREANEGTQAENVLVEITSTPIVVDTEVRVDDFLGLTVGEAPLNSKAAKASVDDAPGTPPTSPPAMEEDA